MFILLFDIDHSNNCRCQQYYLKWLFICVVLINCLGLIRATEQTTITTLNIGKNANSASRTSSIISASPVKQQPKPSSVIYIPSLDGIINFICHQLFFSFMLVVIAAIVSISLEFYGYRILYIDIHIETINFILTRCKIR